MPAELRPPALLPDTRPLSRA